MSEAKWSKHENELTIRGDLKRSWAWTCERFVMDRAARRK